MSMTELTTRCPIAKVTNETFVERVVVGGERRREEFQREITWLLKSESQIYYMHGGKVIKEGTTYIDSTGFLSSMNGPRTRGACEVFKIDRESSLELIVMTRVIHAPVRESDDTKAYNAGLSVNDFKKYLIVPHTWCREELINDHWTPLSLQDEIVHEEMTWSSKWTDAESIAHRAAFRARCEQRLVPQAV
ncbi:MULTISPECIES: hypothetical protein [unclassified Dyella]|uniref:hypothetical protein n=1 Tax=Dyella sp. ASV21 TaxID=2795114 RepID=UPI0018EB7CA3|nr:MULTISPECIES: hypothetical protein [unclassified Dyella]